MNKFKKALALICCAVLLVCISIGATIAYLTSTTEVVQNTFTVGDIKIALDEADVDEYGDLLNDKGEKFEEGDKLADRVLANEYKLMPGHTYVKDPMVTVEAGSEEAYVRMFVTITDIADVKAVFGEDFLPEDFVEGWKPATWISKGICNEENNSATYEFWYFEAVDAREAEEDIELAPLFTHIKIPGENIDIADLDMIKEVQINVIAHAIQTDGFSGMEDAWANYDGTEVMPVAPIPAP